MSQPPSENWMDDIFGKMPRPDHADLAKLSEVLLRIDSRIDPVNKTDQENEIEWRRVVAEAGIDHEVVSYSALQRAMRMAGVKSKLDMTVKAGQVMGFSSLWIDGFIAGALFTQKGE